MALKIQSVNSKYPSLRLSKEVETAAELRQVVVNTRMS